MLDKQFEEVNDLPIVQLSSSALSSPWFSSPMWVLEAQMFFYTQSIGRGYVYVELMWVSIVTYSKQYDHIMPTFLGFISNPSLLTRTKTCLILSSMLTSSSDFSH